MNVRHVCKWCVVSAIVALGWGLGLNKALSAKPDPADAEKGVQVLTRGPVHEAFAETVTYDPEPGIVVPKTPPAAIEEVPPEQRLEGAHVAWIPGYWGWDDERSDFLWVSGIWRALPPGRQWVPGYPGLFIRLRTNVPPVAFKVLEHKHLYADTEARDGFADCFSTDA